VVLRYKKELAAAVERQSQLEQSRAQLELDWQRRCEDLERTQFAQSEDLVKTLTTARNDVSELCVLWRGRDAVSLCSASVAACCYTCGVVC